MHSALLLDAADAAGRLGISRATLYAYVSRGLVQVHADPRDSRRRLYSAGDIERLARNKARGRKPEQAAAEALDWGLPALASRITLIEGGRLFYRGRDAAALSAQATLEDTARLLWDCAGDDPFAAPLEPAPADWRKLTRLLAETPPLERCLALLPLAGADAIWQRDPGRLRVEAAGLLRTATAALLGIPPATAPIHRQLAAAWGLGARPAGLLRAALVLLADHELNASAFAVRVVASTGASLAACLAAGLVALSGPRHGGQTSLVELLFDEVERGGVERGGVGRGGDARRVVQARLRRGDGLPGFGHPLYPAGDPRAAALLPLLPAAAARDRLLAAVAAIGGQPPNVDFALVALRRALKLPPGGALTLFAIGRAVGWIAHALEQQAENRLIRPRARYVGPAPER